MGATGWFVVVGALLVVMGVATCRIERLPLTTSMLYFVVGWALIDATDGPFAALDPVRHPAILERITEIVVIVSLFVAGLKLRTPFADRRWVTPFRLATVSMIVTVGLVAALGVWGLGLPLGAAVLLGAILAPTDPVLASDVQVDSPTDRDRLRFALTAEAGLNDGTAFPFVMLGLGLLGLHELGPWGMRWLGVDVLWAAAAGLAIGWACGMAVGYLVLWMRRTHKEAVGADDLLALGLIALSYGLALACKAYGFLAVFAAGLALRRIEARETARHAERADEPPPAVVAAAGHHADGADGESAATAPESAPAYMAGAALGATEQLERIGEAAVVLILGGLFGARFVAPEAWWFVPVLLLVVRPLAVAIGAPMRGAPGIQRRLTMWFGIRGIGSLYYLTYATAHGLPPALAERLTALTFTTIVVSLAVHGISVTPLMRRYRARVAPAPAASTPGSAGAAGAPARAA